MDHIVTYDLPPDPAFAAAAPTAPAAGATSTTTTPTIAQQAQANRDYVAQQLALVEVARGPQYDFGRGTNKRTDYYKSSGLGGNMQRILDLNRPGLGFDIFGAIETGAKAGLAKYKAEAPAAGGGSGPSLSISNPLAGVLPDWLTKAQLPASVRDIGGGVISSVTKAAGSSAPANPNAIAATTVRTAPRPAAAGGVNWIIVGGVAVGGYLLAKAALR
jgi:hypothetical protein